MLRGQWWSWPGTGELVGFLIGWVAGWLALARCRRLPAAGEASVASSVVIVPARDEAGAISAVVAPLAAHGVEVVVVDDASRDATAALAAAAGARVVSGSGPPTGWLGKPAACRLGVDRSDGEALVFLDADVTPPADLVERLLPVVAAHPDALVSVQPWHCPGSAAEQLSLPFNVVALMGSGACLPWRSRRALAFGPVLACRRDRYEAVGGHGHPAVRDSITEDLALGRQFGTTVVFTGPGDVTFRMFPGGVRAVLDGWTKHIAIGAGATRPVPALLAVAWVWSQLAAWPIGAWAAVLALVQLWVLGRRAGRFAWWAVLAGPVLFGVFVAVLARSFARRLARRPVSWKGRDVEVR